MLAIQEYLNGGKTHDDLATELGIKTVRHDELPLCIVNYCQIASPKTHPIVREARGLVLHAETHELVARSFPRFFNWGEVADEMKDFDFSDFYVQSKEDGSLAVLYWFDGQWRVNTRGSFAGDKINGCKYTWEQGICEAMGIAGLHELDAFLDRGYCYVCEFCSPWNKVIRRYDAPLMYLLTVFDGHDELPIEQVDALHLDRLTYLFKRPSRYPFASIEQIQDFLRARSESDPTFEGVVICDRAGHRWKIKSATYLGLHRLKGDGDNLFNPKNLIPFILTGEDSELLTYFPEVEETYLECKAKVNQAFKDLESVWEANWRIDDQKSFAVAISGKTPFTGILFTLRKKHGANQTRELLAEIWRDSADAILKQVFKKWRGPHEL